MVHVMHMGFDDPPVSTSSSPAATSTGAVNRKYSEPPAVGYVVSSETFFHSLSSHSLLDR